MSPTWIVFINVTPPYTEIIYFLFHKSVMFLGVRKLHNAPMTKMHTNSTNQSEYRHVREVWAESGFTKL